MKLAELFPVVAEFEDETKEDSPHVSALHSGNLGDIIYSLPTCYLLNVTHVVINICSDPWFGGRVVTEKSARALAPLLLKQGRIKKVTIIRTGVPWEYANAEKIGVDYILDAFRSRSPYSDIHLVYQHALPFNLSVDATKSWLNLGSSSDIQTNEKYVVVSLTGRYRRYGRDYYESLLGDLPPNQVFYVGLEEEQVQRANLPGTAYRVENFLDLAKLISRATLFIGNPSLPYALAEGLKVNRLVELPENNNVYPLDTSGLPLHTLDTNFIRDRIMTDLGLLSGSSYSYQQVKQLQREIEDFRIKDASGRYHLKSLVRELKNKRTSFALLCRVLNRFPGISWIYRKLITN